MPDFTKNAPPCHPVSATTPWRQRPTQLDAMNVACEIRTSNPAKLYQAILFWPAERVAEALIAAAAMVDIDRPLSHLLNWDTNGDGACQNGHAWTHESSYIDGRTGHRRCRICAREYRAAKRAEARTAVA